MDSKQMVRIKNSTRLGFAKVELGEMRGSRKSSQSRSKKWYKRQLVKVERRYGRALIRHEAP